MKRRDTIFDRLALKEKMFINQEMQNLGTLHNELKKIEHMRQKLSNMQQILLQKLKNRQPFFFDPQWN